MLLFSIYWELSNDFFTTIEEIIVYIKEKNIKWNCNLFTKLKIFHPEGQGGGKCLYHQWPLRPPCSSDGPALGGGGARRWKKVRASNNLWWPNQSAIIFFSFLSFSVSDKPTNVRHTQLREQQYSRKKKKIAPQPPSLVSSVTVPGIERVIRLSVEELVVKTRNFKLSLFLRPLFFWALC